MAVPFGELVSWEGQNFDRRADRYDGTAGTQKAQHVFSEKPKSVVFSCQKNKKTQQMRDQPTADLGYGDTLIETHSS